MCVSAFRGQKSALNLLELELQVVCANMDVGSKLGSSATAVPAFNLLRHLSS